MKHPTANTFISCILRNIVIACCLLIFSTEFAFPQDTTKPVYLSFAYIKVKPGKGDAYRDLVKNYSKKIFQSQLKDGTILGWYLNQVLMPSGANEEYDYIGVTVTRDYKSLFDPIMTNKQMLKKVFSTLDDKKIEDLNTKYTDTRAIVKREIYTNYTLAGPPGTPFKYAWVTYQQPQPGKLAESEKWEKDNWTPIHKASIELGGMTNWGVYTLEMPYNADNKYSYLTINFFDDMSQLENEFKYTDAMKKAWPNTTIEKIFQLPGGEKKPYKTELLKLIEYVDSSTK